MTLAHRQRHRRLSIALTVLLPLLLISGLLARRPIPVMSRETGLASARTPNPPLP